MIRLQKIVNFILLVFSLALSLAPMKQAAMLPMWQKQQNKQ